ncbi:MAG: TIGR04013 family B12-binding domain/radical SAM domain-containing protein [candidate division WOR-3 bacterium]
MKEYSVFIFYHKNNRNSFRALLGALEKYDLIDFFDFYFPKSFDEFFKILEEKQKFYKFSFVLFSLMTTQFIEWKENLERIKNYRVLKLAGGPHTSGLPLSLLEFFDFLFYGEGEESLPVFLKNFIENRDYKNTKGVIYKEDGKIFINKSKGFIDLNEFPVFSKKLCKYGPIEITRGCIFGCKYCQVSYFMGKNLRHRKIEIILGWVEELFKSKMKDIRFITPNAFSYGSYKKGEINIDAIYNLLYQVRNIVKKEGRIFFGSFPSEVRPDYINDEVIRIVKEFCDNKNIVIGCQSGSERVLEYIRRGHDLSCVLNAVEKVKKYGFVPIVDFIIGFPEERSEDLKKTIDFSLKLMEKGCIVHFHYFMPLPATPFWNKKSSFIEKNFFKNLGKYTKEGKLFGSFEKQYEYSKRIREMFELKME